MAEYARAYSGSAAWMAAAASSQSAAWRAVFASASSCAAVATPGPPAALPRPGAAGGRRGLALSSASARRTYHARAARSDCEPLGILATAGDTGPGFEGSAQNNDVL
jgi:hypothetical protein